MSTACSCGSSKHACLKIRFREADSQTVIVAPPVRPSKRARVKACVRQSPDDEQYPLQSRFEKALAALTRAENRSPTFLEHHAAKMMVFTENLFPPGPQPPDGFVAEIKKRASRQAQSQATMARHYQQLLKT